jgi:hypothetical protein
VDPGDEQLGLKQSDIIWGPAGSMPVPNTRPRENDDNKTEFDATNLMQNTKYQFQVRDCDAITCSQWSDPLTVATDVASDSQITIYLDSVAPTKALGTVVPDFNGSFSEQSVQIPAQTSAGAHALIAVGGKNRQSDPLPITVLGANQQATPQLGVYSQNANIVIQTVVVGNAYSLLGSGFTPSGTVNAYLDQVSGKPFATATVDNDGSFQAKLTMPNITSGNHSFVAVETVNGQTEQASAGVYVEHQAQ